MADAVSGDAAVASGDGAGIAPGSWLACIGFATTYCEKLSQCYPHPLQSWHGTLGMCTQRETLRCALTLAAPDAEGSVSAVAGCTAVLKAETCDFVGEDSPPLCWFASGKRADGQGCGTSSQCKGRYCRMTSGKTCGVCATQAATGDVCTEGQCKPGNRCVFDPEKNSYRCRFHEAKGGPCNDNYKFESACGWGLTCGTGGICGAAGAKVGAGCANSECRG